MNPRLTILLLGALLLANESLGEKGAFEQILDVNLGKGLLQLYFAFNCLK